MHRFVHDDARERGAAVVEFVMIAVLLMFLLFAVLQVAVYFYVRNIVAASAERGARYGANSGVAAGKGGAHADKLIRMGLGGGAAKDVRCHGSPGTDAATGLELEVVRCRWHAESIFVPVPLGTVTITSRVLKEPPP